MRILSHFRSKAPAQRTVEVLAGTEKDHIGAFSHSTEEEQREELSKDSQAGIQKIEAATTVWTKWHLIAAYAL